MCGIAGFVDIDARLERDDALAALRRMTDSITHRGPDDFGHFLDSGIGLGHRRLSVIDLSPAGHQPMFSASDRYVTVYNGEIYNYRELRSELEPLGHNFKGGSDTEILLAAIEQWGVEEALRRSNGMLALALWDRREHVLWLARDRAGKKPLYYGWASGALVFGSELKALRVFPGFDRRIDRAALAQQMRFNYIPAPRSIYQHVYKMKPGTCLELPMEKLAALRGSDLQQFSRPFWSFSNLIEEGLSHPWQGTGEEAVDQLDDLIKASVRRRMVSDVPLGALLSGGIDSSVVTAAMQAVSSKPVRTFSIGFTEDAYNEAPHAHAVATHLGTEHTELYVTPEEAMDVIPEMPAIYDEPFSDSSQIPTYLVSKLARQDVTVALSGDGGDELFGGYNRYFLADRYWSRVTRIPAGIRRLTANGIGALPSSVLNTLLGSVSPFLPGSLRVAQPGDKLRKLAGILGVDDPMRIYMKLCSHWTEPERLVLNASEPKSLLDSPEKWPPAPTFVERMMQLDFLSYLTDDILVKVDRASMAVSLEMRCPLLDPKIIEFAWSLPLSMKVRDGQGKWPLREVLYRYVPRSIVERPKMGFGVPIDEWLRGPLQDWAENLLDEKRLREEGYFDPVLIRQHWEEHLSGQRPWHYLLWDVLMFQGWLECEKT